MALEAAKLLVNKKVRVISMPCMEIFEEQSADYREKLLPPRGALKVSIEAGITQGWQKFTGQTGLNIGLDHYGASAPGKVLAEEFGFTPEKVVNRIKEHLSKLL